MSEEVKISVLEYPEEVRLRTGMYLLNPNHCIQEIIDNSIDEFFAGYCTKIDIVVNSETGKICIQDNGRGIPVAMSDIPKYKGISQLELALTTLHGGGKFGDNRSNSYTSVTSGLNGVGASCVNAVSSYFKAEVYRDKNYYSIEFKEGRKTVDFNSQPLKENKKRSGTCISFILDPKIWKEEKINYIQLRKKVKELAYLNPGLTLTYTQENTGIADTHFYPEGLKTYINDLIKDKALFQPIILNNKKEDTEIQIAFTYLESYKEDFYTYVNSVETPRAGDHLTGFKTGIHKAISQYVAENKLKIKDITQDDILEGIVAIISVKVKNPNFEGQGKTIIKMPSLRSKVSQIVFESYYEYLSKNSKTTKIILEKISQASKARIAAKRARQAVREQKNKLSSTSLPGKLTACLSKNPEETEIFLVEGDSAAGSAIQGRDPNLQAILPVFGKILNAKKNTSFSIFSSSKILDVVKALGCGYGKNFNIEKLKYHKIIIMADADADGGHIACLWITFFYEFFKEIIEHGYLYIAVSPLFSLEDSKGNIKKYIYNQSNLDNINTSGYEVVRYKGLGELSPIQLWETTMNPEKRKIIKITMKNVEESNKYLEICMGKEVEPRCEYIYANADF